MKRTWYVVQASRSLYVMTVEPSGIYYCVGETHAAQFSLTEARRTSKGIKGLPPPSHGQRQDARRFPRIIKITQETKTIKEG